MPLAALPVILRPERLSCFGVPIAVFQVLRMHLLRVLCEFPLVPGGQLLHTMPVRRLRLVQTHILFLQETTQLLLAVAKSAPKRGQIRSPRPTMLPPYLQGLLPRVRRTLQRFLLLLVRLLLLLLLLFPLLLVLLLLLFCLLPLFARHWHVYLLDVLALGSWHCWRRSPFRWWVSAPLRRGSLSRNIRVQKRQGTEIFRPANLRQRAVLGPLSAVQTCQATTRVTAEVCVRRIEELAALFALQESVRRLRLPRSHKSHGAL